MHLSSAEGKEFVINIALNLWSFIQGFTLLYTELGNGADVHVEPVSCVVVWPERLTVVRITSTIKALLCAIIDNGNILYEKEW